MLTIGIGILSIIVLTLIVCRMREHSRLKNTATRALRSYDRRYEALKRLSSFVHKRV